MSFDPIMPRSSLPASVNSRGRSDGAGSLAPPAEHKPTPANGALSLEDFYQLLAMELKNQDMSNPMDNSEMMNQMVQMATVQAMTTFTDLTVTTYATSMIGKNVEILYLNEETNETDRKQGIVSGVNLSGPLIFLEGETEGYGVANIMHVGEVPPEKEEPGDGEGDGDGDGEKPDPPETQKGPGV